MQAIGTMRIGREGIITGAGLSILPISDVSGLGLRRVHFTISDVSPLGLVIWAFTEGWKMINLMRGEKLRPCYKPCQVSRPN